MFHAALINMFVAALNLWIGLTEGFSDITIVLLAVTSAMFFLCSLMAAARDR